MVQAVWNGQVIADSKATEVVDGNHYFPPEDVDFGQLEESDHQTTCHWKGQASYYHVVVDGQRNEDAAWSYPDPKDEAAEIEDHVAFWNGVEVGE